MHELCPGNKRIESLLYINLRKIRNNHNQRFRNDVMTTIKKSTTGYNVHQQGGNPLTLLLANKPCIPTSSATTLVALDRYRKRTLLDSGAAQSSVELAQ